MHLHGQFRDSDVVSNLFVQPPVATWIMISRSGTLVGRKLGQFLCGKLDFPEAARA